MKKMLLGIGFTGILISPLVSVVACSCSSNSSNKNRAQRDVDWVFSQFLNAGLTINSQKKWINQMEFLIKKL